MSSYYQNPPYHFSGLYAEAPAPPSVPAAPPYKQEFAIPAPPAPSASPYYEYATPAPSSPMVMPVTPLMSPTHSRDSSRRRGTIGSNEQPYIHIHDGRRERLYHDGQHLSAAGGTGISRSNSERGKKSLYIEVAGATTRGGMRGRQSGHSRSASNNGHDYYEAADRGPSGRIYVQEGGSWGGSAYSGSSYDSRENSRPQSRSQSRLRRGPRSPSIGSYDDHHALTQYQPSEHEAALTEQLNRVQLQLTQVQEDAEKRRLEEEAVKTERLRNEEIERKVAEQLELQRKKEQDAAAEAVRQQEAENKRITAAARRLLEEQNAAERAKQKAEEAERAKVQAIIDAERQKYEAAQKGKRTYTKFSKIHLCKEALDERSIAYTEEADHFLVHRFVEKTEQNYLWARTKEIRNYYRQIQDAADKAPTVPGPHGGYVKYVQIAGQPYPIALPVTITHTPGGGQTQKVDPIKIKWTDIFRPTKF